jgi:phosphohistidine phosphatase
LPSQRKKLKILHIHRHAKSDWKTGDLRDYDRPLNDRGIRDMVFMGNLFASKIPRIDLIMTSTALRAMTTAQTFAESLKIERSSIDEQSDLYLSPLKELTQKVNRINNMHDHVMIFGHNPGFSNLVEYYTNEPIDMPTCARAEIHFDVSDWREVGSGTGQLMEFDYPKKHQVG